MGNIIQHGKITFFTWKNLDDWLVEEVSESVKLLLGFNPKDFLSGKISYISLVHPDDLNLVVQVAKKALKDKKDEFTHEIYRIRYINGTYKKVYGHTKIIYNNLGKATCFKGYLFDQTEDLQKREEIDLILDVSSFGLCSWSFLTNEVTFDKKWANILGFDISEIDMSLEFWKSRVHPDDLETYFLDFENYLIGNIKIWENIYRIKHKKGHWIYILEIGKIVKWGSDGKPIKFRGTHTDISKQKEVEEKLIREMQTKESFFALMSHEIRTPMNAILGFIDLLLGDDGLSEVQKEQIKIIGDSSESLLKIINDILDYAKMETDGLVLDKHEFDLSYLLNKATSLFKLEIEKNNNTIEITIEKDVPKIIVGDEIRILQILKNLISNALKFTKNDTVTITVKKLRDSLEFCIADHGLGIDKAMQERLFLPFIQEESSTTRRFGGTGLGLTLCRLLCKVMGGNIWIESKKGVGSSFFFTIDLEESQIFSDNAICLPDNDVEMDINGLKILLVEDNIVNKLIAFAFLEKLNCSVEWAKNGLEALNILKNPKSCFDVVLMDLLMPVMGGIEATNEIINQIEVDRVPPIIALTANVFDTNKKACFDAGMIDFIVKPLKKERLLEVLYKHTNKPAFS